MIKLLFCVKCWTFNSFADFYSFLTYFCCGFRTINWRSYQKHISLEETQTSRTSIQVLEWPSQSPSTFMMSPQLVRDSAGVPVRFWLSSGKNSGAFHRWRLFHGDGKKSHQETSSVPKQEMKRREGKSTHENDEITQSLAAKEDGKHPAVWKEKDTKRFNLMWTIQII